VPVVNVGEPHDPPLEHLDDGDGALVGVEQHLAVARFRDRLAVGEDLVVQPGGRRLVTDERERRQLVTKRAREREPPSRQTGDLVFPRHPADRTRR
jgi:hypothetical protein